MLKSVEDNVVLDLNKWKNFRQLNQVQEHALHNLCSIYITLRTMKMNLFRKNFVETSYNHNHQSLRHQFNIRKSLSKVIDTQFTSFQVQKLTLSFSHNFPHNALGDYQLFEFYMTQINNLIIQRIELTMQSRRGTGCVQGGKIVDSMTMNSQSGDTLLPFIIEVTCDIQDYDCQLGYRIKI